MPFLHPVRSPLRLALAFLLFGAALACSGRADPGEADTGDADTGDASDGIATPDAICPLSLIGSLPAGTSAAKGAITASNLSAGLCSGGAYARVLSRGASYDTSPYFFELSSNVDDTSAPGFGPDFVFQSPSGANDGEIVIDIGLPSLGPGTYTGSGSPACGLAAFTYSLPVPPSVDCSGGTDTQCPAGCGRACPAFGCSGVPCVAQAPTVSYVANGATDCMGNATSPLGSWTLTLSSATAAESGTSTYDALFTPHGSLTMSMPAADGGADVARLSATF